MNISKNISFNIIDEQKLLIDSYNIMGEQCQNQIQQLHKTAKNKWKSINKVFQDIQEKFKDYVKRETIQRLSLIRNMQYDIDVFIKKCGLFDDQLAENNKETVQIMRKNSELTNESSKKKQKDRKKIGKMAWQKTQFQSLDDNCHIKFMKMKEKLVSINILESKSQQKGQQQQHQLKTYEQLQKRKDDLRKIISTSKKQEFSKYLQKTKVSILSSKQKQKQKQNNQIRNELISIVESYRMKNIFKFENSIEFDNLKALVKFLVQNVYEQYDLPMVRNIILYSSSYFCLQDMGNGKTQKLCIFDAIKKQLKFLKDTLFWKFFLLSAIQQTVSNYDKSQIQKSQKSYKSSNSQKSQNQKQSMSYNLHITNAVYSTLLSNSLQMIGCGIQKQEIKNLIQKCGKSFGLEDQQIDQLLKFVQNGYENYEKNRINNSQSK